MGEAVVTSICCRKNVLIPLSDGVELAADLFMPSEIGAYPAIVSSYPYHKDDIIGAGLEYSCKYFAQHGYAHLLVDLRGLGNSDGQVWDESSPGERRDSAEIVEWAAHQPWCNGNVGMWGISYGGSTALEAASERAPHLKAIAAVFASSSPYRDFQYPGGCLNCLGAYGDWGSRMVTENIMPPGYQDADGRWYRLWKERLQSIKHQMFSWHVHPDYDDYWREAEIPIGKIQVPTFVIGGWRDLFPAAMTRIFQELTGPKKLVMGPWMHNPMDLSPQEPWDYQYELRRWWDFWLKGESNGIMDGPPVSIYVQGIGLWRGEDEWPIARTRARELFLSVGRALRDTVGDSDGSEIYLADPTVGIMSSLYDPLSRGVGLPRDQVRDDTLSLAFTTEPLAGEIEITGSPEVLLYLQLVAGKDVNLVAKLCDVGLDGSSSLVTTGWLRGSHRNSPSQPEALENGKICEFRIPLWATAYTVAKGHSLRLSISCSDFPRIWPTKTNPEIRVVFGRATPSCLTLPVVPPCEAPSPLPPLRRPDGTENRMLSQVEGSPIWRVAEDLTDGTVEISSGSRLQLALEHGLKLTHWNVCSKASVSPRRPECARIVSDSDMRLELPAVGTVDIVVRTWATSEQALAAAKITVNGREFFESTWKT